MNPRTPIERLRLAGSPNLKRALGYKPAPEKAPAKQAEMELLFADIMARRDEALAVVKKDGLMILQDHFNRDKLYQKKVVHPALKVVQQCESALARLAKVLAASADEGAGDGMSEEFADIFEKYQGAKSVS